MTTWRGLRYNIANTKDDVRFKITTAVTRVIFRLLNWRVCGECGVVALGGGMDAICEDGSFIYYCERCNNAGFIAEDLRRVEKEFGSLLQPPTGDLSANE